MEIFYVVLFTIIACQLLNFIVLALVEKLCTYEETVTDTMVYLNTFVFLIPFKIIYNLPKFIYSLFFKYELFILNDDCSLLVRNINKKRFAKKDYLDDRETSRSLKNWKKHEYFGEKVYHFIKRDGYILLLSKE